MVNESAKSICEDLTITYNNLLGENIKVDKVLHDYENLIDNSYLLQKYEKTLDKLFSGKLDEHSKAGFVMILNKLNEEFFNPFYDDEFAHKTDDDYDDDDVNSNDKIGVDVISVKCWDGNIDGKIFTRDGKMYAGKLFLANDIIERCPIKVIDKISMFSKDINDLAFELDTNSDTYGIPYGYANLYRTSQGDDANIDFEYDPQESIIKFKAIKKIRPKDELILLCGE